MSKESICGSLPFAGLVAFLVLFVASVVFERHTVIWSVLVLVSFVTLLSAVIYSLWKLQKNAVLAPVLNESVHLISMIFLIVIGTSIFALVFRGFGGDETVHALLVDMPGGTWAVLMLVMLIIFVLGFFLEFLEITYLVVPIVAPVLLSLPMANGELMSPIWLGVLIALNLQTSFLTPPFGVSLFYLRSVAPPAINTAQLYRGVVPYVVLQILCLALVMVFPILATWLPDLLFGG